jgi:hypothetical protein
MHLAAQNFTAANTIFGSGYVPEQHADRMHWNLSSSEVGGAIETQKVSILDEVMKSLRSALSLR